MAKLTDMGTGTDTVMDADTDQFSDGLIQVKARLAQVGYKYV